MNAADINTHLKEKFPEHTFINSDVEEDFGPYQVVETIIDEKISFKHIVKGMNWSDEKILNALELLVLQRIDFFDRKSKELLKEDKELYLFEDGNLHVRAI